MRIIEWS
jgi:hypothetical protein